MENTEMKNGETDAVVSIIAWLDEWIDRTEKTMSAGEDDFSWLADREYLQAYRNARSHMTALRGTDECTVRHLAEWCGIRKREAKSGSDSHVHVRTIALPFDLRHEATHIIPTDRGNLESGCSG